MSPDPGEFLRSVHRFLFDPDGAAGPGPAQAQLAAQDVFAELGGVHAAAARRLHAEAPLKEALQDLQEHTESRVNSELLSYCK